MSKKISGLGILQAFAFCAAIILLFLLYEIITHPGTNNLGAPGAGASLFLGLITFVVGIPLLIVIIIAVVLTIVHIQTVSPIMPEASVPSVSETARLPQKNIPWSVSIISGFSFLFGLFGFFFVPAILIIGSLLSIPGSNDSLTLIYFTVNLIFYTLGLLVGVSYISKRSQILLSDIPKISVFIAAILLILNYITFHPASGIAWVFMAIDVVIEVLIVWLLLKNKAIKIN